MIVFTKKISYILNFLKILYTTYKNIFGFIVKGKTLKFRKKSNISNQIYSHSNSWSSRRINLLIDLLNKDINYLEVGVNQGQTFVAVNAKNKWGVEPAPTFSLRNLPSGMKIFKETSDIFFEKRRFEVLYDLVYLDGLHEWTQTYRDLINSLNSSCFNCFILIDDVIPTDKFSAIPNQIKALRSRWVSGLTGWNWHGDVYKILFVLKEFHPELNCFTIYDLEGNSQLIVCKKDMAQLTFNLNMAALIKFSSLSYDDLFDVDGKPIGIELNNELEVMNKIRKLVGQ